MRKRRLNDTAALVERPPGAGESHRISCRKIENGFLTSVHSFNDGTGKCTEKEVFTKEYPRIRPPELGRRTNVGDSSLGDTIEYLESEPSGLGR